MNIELYPANDMRSRSLVTNKTGKKICDNLGRRGAVTGDDEPVVSGIEMKEDSKKHIARDAHNSIAPRQRFIPISRDKDNGYYPNQAVDGLFGLGLLLESEFTNFIDIMRQRCHINESILSFTLRPPPIVGQSQYTSLCSPRQLAWWPPNQRTESMNLMSPFIGTNRLHWVIKLTVYALDDESMGNFSIPRHLALLTTGENEILAPIAVVQRIYYIIGSKCAQDTGLAFVDCRNLSQLPKLRIGTKRIIINLRPVDYFRQIDGKCYVAILPSRIEQDNYQ